VRRATAAVRETQAPKGAAEGLMLWDAEPSGDRIRARVSYRNTGGLSRVRLGLEPGLVVLSTSIPGLVDTSLQGTKDHPEWVAHIDPPLVDGATG